MTTDELFGGKLIYAADPIQAAQTMISRIMQKRKALGLEVMERNEIAILDMEAGLEHFGRGTARAI